MKKIVYEESGEKYQLGKTLRPWRPQFSVISAMIKNKSKVLDVGCGDGAFGELLIRDKKCEVSGIDLDPIGVKEAKNRGLLAKVHNAEEGLPYKDQSFDIVVISTVIEMTRTPDYIVAEALRVGKKVIISFPNFGFWIYRLELLFGRFPSFILHGHAWWETTMTSFFTLADFLSMPSVQSANVSQIVCIDWRNRNVSNLAKINPNLFGRNCIVELARDYK